MNGFWQWLTSGNTWLGVTGIVASFFLVKDAFYLNHHILFLGWVERRYGPGSGTLAYRLLGVALFFFACLVFIGTINLFDRSAVSSIPGSPQTGTTNSTINFPASNPSNIAR